MTCVLMWIATLAIAGIPPFAGFFSKDEILGAAFARAHIRRSPKATLVRHSRAAALVPGLRHGLAPAFLTAIYMTRMMIYTFHGPNRTGEKERRTCRRRRGS